MRRIAVLLLVLLLAPGVAGCGGTDDLRERGQELRQRAREARDRAERSARRVVDRVRAVLDDLERAVPQATRDSQAPASRDGQLEEYLTSVLRSVDVYWTRTLKRSGVPEPRVSFLWIPPGRGAR